MAEFKIQHSLVVSILLLFATTFTSAYDVPETCKIVPNNTFIADPTNCAGWAFCVNGAPVYGKCGNGLLYNPERSICDYAEDVTCISTDVTTMCTGLNAVFKTNPTNCQSYCYCENGQTGCRLCPTGQVYNPNTNACVWSSTYACSVNSPCTLVPNNVYVQDTANCKGYYKCLNGAATAGTCPDEYLYNSVDGTCDYPQNVKCPSGSSSSNGDTEKPVGTATTCSVLTTGEKFVSDGATCRGYFYCASGSTTTQPAWGQCPTGSHFSQSLQKCVDPYAVACPYNRCEGLSYTFVTTINTDCKDYNICNNGVTDANSEAACPASNPYFNEAMQSCVTTEPSYAIC